MVHSCILSIPRWVYDELSECQSHCFPSRELLMHPPNTQFGSPLWLPRATMMPSAWLFDLFARRHMFPWCLFGPSNFVQSQERKHSSINFTWLPRHCWSCSTWPNTKGTHGCWASRKISSKWRRPSTCIQQNRKRAAGSYTLVSPLPLTTDISTITRS